MHMVQNSTVKFENYINGLQSAGFNIFIVFVWVCVCMCHCVCVCAVYAALKRFLQYCNKTSIIAFYWQMPKVLDNDRDDVDDVERI